MDLVHYAEKMKYEVNLLENRLKMIKQYEKYLLEERHKLEDMIYLQSESLDQISLKLNVSQNIEYKLFKEIMINGLSVTKAIEKVALEESKDESTLWRYYYPKVKEKIANLQAMKDK